MALILVHTLAAAISLIACVDAAVVRSRDGKVAPNKPTTLRGAVTDTAAAMPHMLAAVNKTRMNTTRVNGTRSGGTPPCTCVASDPAWKAPTRTAARCIFIDLGAADGNTFEDFINNKYGSTKNCPNGGQWSAFLVEANPRFDEKLAGEKSKHSEGEVTVLSSHAAYMCEGKTSFFLDTVNTQRNFWGSSMSNNHPDVQRSGGQTKVTVPTVNLNRLLYENTIQGDWVMVKMDIEGAEFDVLPCLAQQDSPAGLVDRLYLEQHDPSWGMLGTTWEQMEGVKYDLHNRGVDMPAYFSQTL